MQPSPDYDIVHGFQIDGIDPPARALIPKTGPVKHLLVFLHGYGANADDLFRWPCNSPRPAGNRLCQPRRA